MTAVRPVPPGRMSTGAAPEPLATDIVDVRLLEAMRAAGCPLCAIRARSEKSIMDSIINERVLDLGFRADLERKQGFCRRHVAELVPTDRRETGGILGSSMLLAAIVERRVAGLRETPLARGRKLRDRLAERAQAAAVHRVWPRDLGRRDGRRANDEPRA